MSLPWTLGECLTPESGDLDLDGLTDACELGLARAFAPALVVSPGGCNWDEAEGRPMGAYLFGVAPGPEGRVRVAYLPAYFRDCGWSGPKCLLPAAGCEGHDGDSELIALSLESNGVRWSVTEIVLSAHCYARSRGCEWTVPPRGLRWVDGRSGGAPVVFVAEGTHAAYPTRETCDAGHFFMDSCDRNHRVIRFPILSSGQNVGSSRRPIGGDGCVSGSELTLGSSSAADAREECLWDARSPFRGWQREARGSPPTSYGRYLSDVLGWE